MRLPRRVPWVSIGELDQVCSWIFTDENDIEAKKWAVNRLSAWKAITPLPHALESSLSVLTAILQDNSQSSPSRSSLFIRQSYATAIIRLVNGLVDPLQLGAYARSIASIAAQLGLPSWLVELRHAATHEDLPSLEVLREAARESMSWLLHNYFLPTINPSSTPSMQSASLRPLAPILKQYKSLMKLTIRDATLKSQYKDQINSLLRDIERWLSEAAVAFNMMADGVEGWGLDDVAGGEDDPKMRWALDKLCDSLLEKGTLVPLSKKKSVFPSGAFSPPGLSVSIWEPLLSHLQSHHTNFLPMLALRIAGFLLHDPQSSDIVGQFEMTTLSSGPGLHFDSCLARWAMWLVQTYDADYSRDSPSFRKDLVVTLITALGPGSADSQRDRKAAHALLHSLTAGHVELEKTLNIFLSNKDGIASAEWSQDAMDVMDSRLNALLELDTDESLSHERGAVRHSSQGARSVDISLPPGWRLLDEHTGWRPSPIGVFYSSQV